MSETDKLRAEIEKLKLWLDTEVTLLHIAFAFVFGLLIKGKFWFVVGIYVFISLAYMTKRASALPRDYLKVKEKFRNDN